MGYYATASLIVIAVSVGLVLLVKKNLEQRRLARRLRAVFVNIADDLISKPELPDGHARQLAEISAVRSGWITRIMVFLLIKEMIAGTAKKRSASAPSLDDVPQNLRVKYITAILAFSLGDSYRCALLGRVWRAANSWIEEAVAEPKPDVNAHATRRVVDLVAQLRPPARVVEQGLECAV